MSDDLPLLIEMDGNPVPGNHVAGWFESVGGKRLRYAIFRSDIPVARGTVVLLQGRNECIEKYFETIRHFTDRGLWVATFDWRGQGLSERLSKNPRGGDVRRFADFESDLSVFLETIVLPDARLPFCLVAHSMGALVALSMAPRLANRIERMVLLAPFIELSNQLVSTWSIRLITRLLRMTGFGRLASGRDRFPVPFADNLLTSDIDRFTRNQALHMAHPELRLAPPSARWINEMLAAMDRVTRFEHLDQIKVPTVLIGAGDDKIVAPQAIESLGNRFRAGRAIMVDGARHELLQEADRYRIPTLAAIDAFIPPDQAAEPTPAPEIKTG
ncbi:alpha/beta hydrolase [Hoeflea sp. YIM 152468]|uniref:alpha/beta fold hydrolase n=1 Tax=Hoeflea sp. YIM 152468 TaxID=3031759 RepID=UPI0023DAD78A|nr:alpha/beta hydrolase [Hoeflea sp. YIM 152468]MDF1607876.1 alpha/beta hydrolase [Hoeflea sp. YIM 152468]